MWPCGVGFESLSLRVFTYLKAVLYSPLIISYIYETQENIEVIREYSSN